MARSMSLQEETLVYSPETLSVGNKNVSQRDISGSMGPYAIVKIAKMIGTNDLLKQYIVVLRSCVENNEGIVILLSLRYCRKP
jgi:hypothetical protein